MKSKMLISLFILSLFMLTGCSKEMTKEEITQRIIEANSNLDLYSISLNMEMSIIAGENLSAGDSASTKMMSTGIINRPLKQAILNSSISTNLLEMNLTVDSQIFIIDDYIYTGMMGMWFKQKLDNDTWIQKDTSAQTLSLLEYAKIEQLKDESFGGASYYVFKIHPNLDKLAEMVLKDQNSDLLKQNVNFSDVFSEYGTIVWINKDSFIIEKSTIDVKMKFSGDTFEYEFKDEDAFEISLHSESRITQIKEPFSIVLPTGAEKATDMTKFASLIEK